MSAIITESLEVVGYENSWSEVIDSGNTLDEDAAIPGIPPPGAGVQNLKTIVVSGTANAAAISGINGNQNVNYFRQYFYWDAETIANGELFLCFLVRNSGGEVVANILVGKISDGVYGCRFEYFSNGSVQSTSDFAINLQQWYRFEFQYDIDSLNWEFRIDRITKASGSLVAATRIPFDIVIGITSASFAAGEVTVFEDLIVWNNANWVGDSSVRNQFQRNNLGADLFNGTLQ